MHLRSSLTKDRERGSLALREFYTVGIQFLLPAHTLKAEGSSFNERRALVLPVFFIFYTKLYLIPEHWDYWWTGKLQKNNVIGTLDVIPGDSGSNQIQISLEPKIKKVYFSRLLILRRAHKSLLKITDTYTGLVYYGEI